MWTEFPQIVEVRHVTEVSVHRAAIAGVNYQIRVLVDAG
jgi:hypothetical protein